ncbi:ABC-2 type transport system ATP-binding protein [Faecalicatena orotica]|uniref:ABC-2 type transport system ATP-binding protein n=1 Tax=Faecalicatena orotica TaxID=1544 RepID=A0A2Y9BFV4_9FIRM|nr:ABC transporter ATP-binding protein [Faecalicatena orotica]PWJ28552.1 ABC-2 type transport system ATP-binding protein [Faecalicatena orotica]SSA56373.1 ABC-2 type transport system ATP-binding protein [Faecalicatena orotica]
MELKIEHLTKKYKDKTAADDVNLTITPGIWGLLGANGAGKTTLMRMIAGIMRPTSGCVKFDGVNIESLGGAYRDIFGYLPQEFGFYPEFTVQDYLEYVAALKGLTKKNTRDKIEELLTRLTLEDVRRKKIVKLSGGMKRRVGIAQALLNEPEVLILDEPTSGLDPGERVRFRNLLSEFAQNRIVLISTHIVPDVEYIAFRNAIMKDGGIVSEGTTEELVGIMEGKVWSTEMPQCDVHKAEQKAKVVNLRNISGSVVFVRYLSEEKIFPDSIEEQPRLEDLYLWLFPQEEAGKEGVR